MQRRPRGALDHTREGPETASGQDADQRHDKGNLLGGPEVVLSSIREPRERDRGGDGDDQHEGNAASRLQRGHRPHGRRRQDAPSQYDALGPYEGSKARGVQDRPKQLNKGLDYLLGIQCGEYRDWVRAAEFRQGRVYEPWREERQGQQHRSGA